MSIIETLKKARISHGMTQSELADKLGWNQKDISRFESGKVSPSAEKLDKIAHELNSEWRLVLVKK